MIQNDATKPVGLSDEIREELRSAGIVAVRGLSRVGDNEIIRKMISQVRDWQPGPKDKDKSE